MLTGPCKSVEHNKMEMLATFLIFDNNKDGFVDATDFKKTLNSMGQPLGEFEAKLIIGEMDKKRQGKLSYDGKFLLPNISIANVNANHKHPTLYIFLIKKSIYPLPILIHRGVLLGREHIFNI